MAKRYEHVSALAREIGVRRVRRGLTFENLGVLAGVDGAQVFRICRGDFKTLNPSVLKICNALGIQPKAEGMAMQAAANSKIEVMLSAEVLKAWDKTESGAKLLTRVLRALHPAPD